MKKTVWMICLMLLGLTLPLQAQLRFGVKGGLNVSSVHFDKEVFDSDNVTGFHVGPMVELMMPGLGLGLDAAFLYSQKGMEYVEDGVKTEVKTDYLDVPVNVKWKFGLPLVKGYVAAGPYVGFRVGGDKFWKVPSAVADQIKAKSFGAGLNLGGGVELISHLQVGLMYSWGLTDNYSMEREGWSKGTGKNRGWTVSAALIF
ncbi:MAG: porin family protein [Parabacteroides sp.]